MLIDGAVQVCTKQQGHFSLENMWRIWFVYFKFKRLPLKKSGKWLPQNYNRVQQTITFKLYKLKSLNYLK